MSTRQTYAPSEPGDAALASRAASGDEDAFAELFGRYEAGVYTVAYRLTGSAYDAADVTQEAFLRVFVRLPDLVEREVNLAAYLHRTARNLVYDRSAARQREVAVEDVELAGGADDDLEIDPNRSTLLDAQRRELRAANARLPERHRLALALREVEGFSYEEIGSVLDITPGAVAQLLARARIALRKELRLEQIDTDGMDSGCRRRLGTIAALLDDQLDADRTEELQRHLSECATCRATTSAFSETGQRYRSWPPLGAIGLAAEAARAAARERQPAGSGSRPSPADRAPPFVASHAGQDVKNERRRRRAALVGIAALVLLVVAGIPTFLAGKSAPGTVPEPASIVSGPDPDDASRSTISAPTRSPSRAPTTTTTPVAPPASPTLAPSPARPEAAPDPVAPEPGLPVPPTDDLAPEGGSDEPAPDPVDAAPETGDSPPADDPQSPPTDASEPDPAGPAPAEPDVTPPTPMPGPGPSGPSVPTLIFTPPSLPSLPPPPPSGPSVAPPLP